MCKTTRGKILTIQKCGVGVLKSNCIALTNVAVTVTYKNKIFLNLRKTCFVEFHFSDIQSDALCMQDVVLCQRKNYNFYCRLFELWIFNIVRDVKNTQNVDISLSCVLYRDVLHSVVYFTSSCFVELACDFCVQHSNGIWISHIKWWTINDYI